jgi:hypothetical protein
VVDETLDVLAECGVTFTILAPHQVAALPPHGLPGRYRTSHGRTIALCMYDGPLSHDVAFGPLTRDATRWTGALADAPGATLLGIATDGETYGHHHRFGEMALAAVLDQAASRRGMRVENYAAFLARHPATHDVALQAPSSWSCAHGVERWRAECGCRLDAANWPSQAWRTPLRQGLDELQQALHAQFEREGGALFTDPWAARDAYGAALAGAVSLTELLDRQAPRADAAGRQRAAALLEMERHALGMMTSCGWFFDDISGLESVQVLRYAARAIQLAGPAGISQETALRERLAAARSNDARAGTGRDLYDRRARPAFSAGARVAAGVAAAAAVGADPAAVVPEAYDVRQDGGALVVRHRRTGETSRIAVAITRARPGRIEMTTGPADAPAPAPISLSALPARARRAVRETLVRELMDLWLSEEESAAVCRGVLLAEVAIGALVRAIDALATEPGALAGAEVVGLLDLLELLEVPVPIDAQAAFARARTRLPRDGTVPVALIADRLGFA